jgi:hypothetical protein
MRMLLNEIERVNQKRSSATSEFSPSPDLQIVPEELPVPALTSPASFVPEHDQTLRLLLDPESDR